MDVGEGGSYQNLGYSFLLNFDSTSWACLADPNTGLVTAPEGITVSVKHRVHSEMSYNEFFAACAAWYYAVFQIATHVTRIGYILPNSGQLYSSFDDLQTALANGTASFGTIDGDSTREGVPNPGYFYHNVNSIGLPVSSFINTPYPLWIGNPALSYDVPLANYIVDPHVLCWTIRGVLQDDQPDPVATFGYPFIYDPSYGRARFEGLVISVTVSNGQIVYNPNDIPTGYLPIGPADPLTNMNSYFFGRINPKLVDGRSIGYIYRRACDMTDPLGLMGLFMVCMHQRINRIRP